MRVLDRLGLDHEVLDDGCCGLAGSFGYEAGERYEVSMRAGEQQLLSAVRETAAETLVITDGFSCRSQIEHGAGRGQAMHLAEVIALAYRESGRLPAGAASDGHVPHRAARAAAATLAGAGVLAGAGMLVRRRR